MSTTQEAVDEWQQKWYGPMAEAPVHAKKDNVPVRLTRWTLFMESLWGKIWRMSKKEKKVFQMGGHT